MGYFGTPTRIVCDQDPAFTSHLCQWFLYSYGIHVTTASPTNHQSLMAEHGIKSLANILMKHLTGLGDNWPSYCKPAMLSYNSYATPNLDNLSPFEIAHRKKGPHWPLNLNTNLGYLSLVPIKKPRKITGKIGLF